MAITFVGANSVDGGANSAASTAALSLPAGAQAADLCITVASVERDLIPEINWSGGSETTVRNENVAGVAACRIEWKRLTSGDLGGTVQATVATARRIAMGYIVLRGAGDPVFTNSAHVLTGSGVFTGALPAATPTVNDSWLVGIMAAISSLGTARTLTWQPGAGYTKQVEDSSTSTSSNAGIYISTKPINGGAGVSQAGDAPLESDRFGYFPTTVVVPPAGLIPAGWDEVKLYSRV